MQTIISVQVKPSSLCKWTHHLCSSETQLHLPFSHPQQMLLLRISLFWKLLLKTFTIRFLRIFSQSQFFVIVSKLVSPTIHLPNHVTVSPVYPARNFGVIDENNIYFAPRIFPVSKSWIINIPVLRHSHNMTKPATASTIATSLIHTTLIDYCNSLLLQKSIVVNLLTVLPSVPLLELQHIITPLSPPPLFWNLFVGSQ